MTTRARMMALIDTFADELPLVREIAGSWPRTRSLVSIDFGLLHTQAAGFEAQSRQLNAAGCEKVFSEQVSAVAAKREQLGRLERLGLVGEA